MVSSINVIQTRRGASDQERNTWGRLCAYGGHQPSTRTWHCAAHVMSVLRKIFAPPIHQANNSDPSCSPKLPNDGSAIFGSKPDDSTQHKTQPDDSTQRSTAAHRLRLSARKLVHERRQGTPVTAEVACAKRIVGRVAAIEAWEASGRCNEDSESV